MTEVPPAVPLFAAELARLGWVTDVFVAGSVATGDYVPGVSDLDLVALADGPLRGERTERLADLHRAFDAGPGAGQSLGCAYVDSARVGDRDALHPTWTHGSLVDRTVSGITRAELVLHGLSVLGRQPQDVLAPMGPDDVREAARAELLGYWARAARHPWWWLDPVMPDLGLTAMARGRHTVSTGQLLTKTRAIEQAHAPYWLRDQMRARRRGERVGSPRVRSAAIAWRDARRTVASTRRRETMQR